MIDSNGNGTVDQDEIDRLPSFMRDMMRSRGLDLRPGMSLDQMRNSMQGGNRDENRDPNDSGGVNGAPVLTPYKMKPKKSLTLSLPPAYSEVDTDFDGQLGLYEWMMTRRADLDLFDEMDTDHDGFLIPEELQASEAANQAAAANAVASADRKKLTIIGAPVRAGRGDGGRDRDNDRGDNNRGDNNYGPGRWGGGGNEAERAPQYFAALDRDQSGVVEASEWQESRRVRGMFEQGGIPITDMNLDQFTQNMSKLSQNSENR